MKLNAFIVQYLKNDTEVNSKYKADKVELQCWYGTDSHLASLEIPVDADAKEVVKNLRLMANQIEKDIEQ